MKYFETVHERNSAKITALITAIILLLMFVMGTTYMDPPIEYGVAVNFGNTDYGSGPIQPEKPIKSEVNKIVEETKPQETKTEPVTATDKTEEVLTQDTEESIAIKKEKEAQAKAKAETERKERERQEAEEKKRQEEEAKKKNLDALIGGVKNSDGTKNTSDGTGNTKGNQGQLDGDPYAPSYFGNSGPGKGGVGYGLKGMGRPSNKIFKQDCNEEGLVIVMIEVDRNGNVTKAEPGARGTTNPAPCLYEPAKKIAMSFKWPSDSNAPVRQIGFVSINFSYQN